jgi:POT family proton-dependent oligopeptide transporter
LADRYLGSLVVVLWLAMTLGHASMAVETPLFLYIELGFYYRNGLFKPNMTSIISNAYHIIILRKKDGAYSMYYMGVNAGFFRDYVVWVYYEKFELGFD